MAETRFVVDENLVRVARAMDSLRRDTVCIGDAEVADILPRGILDPDWIPIVGARGWTMITDDRRLRTRPAEARLCIEYRLKVIHLLRMGHLPQWEQFRLLVARWPTIEQHLAESDGPLWLSVRQRQVRAMRFEPGAVER